ncbi:hypothetical protein DL93DRAFT_2080274, partial [Clavulina sp. PMI_390]
MPHEVSHTFVVRSPTLRHCDICTKYVMKANHCQQCDDYDECHDCFVDAPRRWAAIQAAADDASKAADEASKAEEEARAAEKAEDDARKALHKPEHRFVPIGEVKQCDLCGAMVKVAFHCKQCANYDECEACYNEDEVPAEAPKDPSEILHEPYHAFDLIEQRRSCDLCKEQIDQALHCKVCPDYDECLNCFTGGAITQAAQAAREIESAPPGPTAWEVATQVAKTVHEQHENMENAKKIGELIQTVAPLIQSALSAVS